MKNLQSRWVVLILILLMCIIFIFGVLLLRGGEDDIKINQESIYLYSENQDVLIKKEEGDAFEQTNRIKTLIFEGYTVKTTDSYAHVELPDQSLISLSPNTQITLEISSGEETKIKQIFGNTWHRVQSLLNKENSSYEVDTFGIQTSVKGTEFALMTEDESVLTFVEEGSVEMRNELGKKTLNQGDYQKISQTGFEELDSESIKQTDFYKRNILLKKGNIDIQSYKELLVDNNIQDLDFKSTQKSNSEESISESSSKESSSSSSRIETDSTIFVPPTPQVSVTYSFSSQASSSLASSSQNKSTQNSSIQSSIENQVSSVTEIIEEEIDNSSSPLSDTFSDSSEEWSNQSSESNISEINEDIIEENEEGEVIDIGSGSSNQDQSNSSSIFNEIEIDKDKDKDKIKDNKELIFFGIDMLERGLDNLSENT